MNKLKELFNQYISSDIKSHILKITRTYLDAGYECWIVGGPVRDLLLNHSPKDIDFATNCPLEITKTLFQSIIPTGEDHGTLTIHIDGENYEVTRYRKDVDTDGRRATIAFANTIQEDVLRRDLTINAIAFNPVTGEVVDAVGGIADFDKKLIKFVGKAEDRIQEDQLRVLRYLRFIVRFNSFGFKPIIEEFDSVIKSYKPNVVSIERIYQELNSMFLIIKDNNQMKPFLVETLQNIRIFERFSERTKMDMVVFEIFETMDFFPLVRFTQGDISSVKLCSEYKKMFKIYDEFKDNDFKDEIDVKDLLERVRGDFEMARKILSYITLLDKPVGDSIKVINKIEKDISRGMMIPFQLSDLAIDGNDLMIRNYKGKEIKTKLHELLMIVKNNPELNNKDYLLEIL